MISVTTQLQVDGVKGRNIVAFLVHCDDEKYQHWWPGTHLQLHLVKGSPGDIGSLIYMDEFVGKHRVRFTGEVVEHMPGRKLVIQMKSLVRLPVKLVLAFDDNVDGVEVTHSLQFGYGGIGRIFDPLIRRLVSSGFSADMEEHVRTEFRKLATMLRESCNKSETASQAPKCA